MLLFELMNKALPVEEVNVDEDEAVYRFDVPDGRVYLIEYDKLNDSPEVWEASFRDSGDTSASQYELTNKGSEIPILVTAFTHIGQFIQAHPEAVVFFTADDNKRAGVYGKMMKRVTPNVVMDKSPEGKTQFYVGNMEAAKRYQQTMAELNTPR